MDPSDLLERLAQTFESLRVPYLITGSMATIAYGEPRFTNDIDVVVRLACRKPPAALYAIVRTSDSCFTLPRRLALRTIALVPWMVRSSLG